MNKKILTIVIYTFIFLILFVKMPLIHAEDLDNFKLIIEDDANLLDQQQKQLLEKRMKPLTEYGNIVFKTIYSNNTSTSNYALNYYHEKFGSDSGTLFLIDMYNREIYIFSDGYNYKIINDSKAYIITDNIYINMQ